MCLQGSFFLNELTPKFLLCRKLKLLQAAYVKERFFCMESRGFHGNRPPSLSENWNHEPKQGLAASLFLQGLHISTGCVLLSGANQLSLSHFLKAQLGFPSFLPAESTVTAQQVRACFHWATLFCVSVSVCCDLSSSTVPFSVLLCPWGLTCMNSVG